ncbi:MAG: hypothetical protein JSV30_06710 [Candidatus Omnitrophota bacterium]|nr:MAG: hypothetical protein JSV30_06710 [Candidatus Omnitrophota bacterium]
MKFLTVVLVFAGLLCVSVDANAAMYADNFDDEVMDASLWSLISEGGDLTNLYESSGVLNLTSTGAYENSSKDYISKWAYNLNKNFRISAKFNYNYTGGGDSAVSMGIVGIDPDGSIGLHAGIRATRCDYPNYNGDYFKIAIEDASGQDVVPDQWYPRGITAGYFSIEYDAKRDSITFAVFNNKKFTRKHQVISYTYDNFSLLNLGAFRIYIGGYADGGALLVEGEANLDNFKAKGDTKSTDLTGTWTVKMNNVSMEGYTTEEVTMYITDQQGNLFRGYVTPEDYPYTNFYGALVGKDIYITFWDSTASGKMEKGGEKFSFVSQNQKYNPPNSPATAIGIAVKNKEGF